MSSANTNTACLVLTNNTSDAYELRQNDTSLFNIEQLATAGTRNTGNIVTAGTLTDVVAGFCGLP